MVQRLFKITASEQRTFLLHMVYSIIDGIILGLFALNEFILIKSLKGTNYQIGFLVQTAVVVLLFSIVINEFFRRIRRKKMLIRYVGIFTRLPLVFFAFFPASAANADNFFYYQVAFLLIFFTYFMASPLLLPAINHLLKNSYTHTNFGRLYGYASSANKGMMLVATFLFGWLLDYNHYAFIYVYPVVAILGIIAVFFLTKIQYEAPEFAEPKKKFSHSVLASLKNSVFILKNNKPYRDFEIAFMLYGFAWMTSAAIITIFFEKELHLNYTSIAFYKNSYNIIAILVLPYFGKIIGKIDPRKFAIFTFMAMLLHLFFMGLTEYTPAYFNFWEFKVYYSLIASYVFYGLFAAMMGLLWYIGSAYFCKNEDAAGYQSIHLSLTGLRGVFAPLVGVFFYELVGFAGVFGLGVLSLGVGIWVMRNSMRKHQLVLKQEAKIRN